jgi:rhodanese-related sulfurtransferase
VQFRMNIHTIKRLLLLSLSVYFFLVSILFAEDVVKKVPINKDGSYFIVEALTLKKMLEKKDFLFINVHIPYEGEIEGTDLFIPYNQIQENLNKLPSDKNAKIVLYCRSDRMSVIAAHTLVKFGYSNIWSLEGGMMEWKRAGFPLVNKRYKP